MPEPVADAEVSRNVLFKKIYLPIEKGLLITGSLAIWIIANGLWAATIISLSVVYIVLNVMAPELKSTPVPLVGMTIHDLLLLLGIPASVLLIMFNTASAVLSPVWLQRADMVVTSVCLTLVTIIAVFALLTKDVAKLDAWDIILLFTVLGIAVWDLVFNQLILTKYSAVGATSVDASKAEKIGTPESGEVSGKACKPWYATKEFWESVPPDVTKIRITEQTNCAPAAS